MLLPLYFRIKRKCEDKIINTLLVILVYKLQIKFKPILNFKFGFEFTSC
jgi:hypothetical protein